MWKRLQIPGGSPLRALLAPLQSFFSPETYHRLLATISFELSLRQRSTIDLYLWAGAQRSEYVALGWNGRTSIHFEFGPFRFLKRDLACQIITPYLIDAPPSPTGARRCDDEIPIDATRLSALEDANAVSGVVRFEDVPVIDACIQALITTVAPQEPFMQFQLKSPSDHQYIKLPRTFSDYEMEIGYKKRKRLRYTTRRLADHVNDIIDIREYTSISSVDEFLEHATSISRHTYQWRQLGLGLRNRSAIARLCINAAHQNYFRSFILFCRGAPVAFLLGMQISDIYRYLDVGYDPRWARWSVGTVLQFETLRRILTDADPATWWDFSFGDGEHKRRFANFSVPTASLLYVRRFSGLHLTLLARDGFSAVDRTLSRSLDLAGLKDHLRRRIRHRSES